MEAQLESLGNRSYAIVLENQKIGYIHWKSIKNPLSISEGYCYTVFRNGKTMESQIVYSTTTRCLTEFLAKYHEPA